MAASTQSQRPHHAAPVHSTKQPSSIFTLSNKLNRFLSGDIIKGIPPVTLQLPAPAHFPTPLPLTFSPASCWPCTYLWTGRNQRAKSTARMRGESENRGGQESCFTTVSSTEAFFRRLVPSTSSFRWWQSVQPLLYETNMSLAPGSA